jgi:hypothetical protein
MKSLRLKRFNIMGFTMLIVVLPFCFYYLFFVSSQTNYYSKRNFRVLAEIGQHISTKIDNVANNLMYLAEKAKQDKSRTMKIEDKSDATRENSKQAAKPVADVQKIEKNVTLVPGLKFDPAQYQQVQPAPTQQAAIVRKPAAPRNSNANTATPGESTAVVSTKPSRSPATPRKQRATAAKAQTTSKPSVTMRVKPEQGSFWLYLEYRGASDALPANFPVSSELNTLIEPFVSRYVIDEVNETQERLFDEVLVAEQETGRVIFQQGPSGLNVVTLDSILNSKGGKLELKLADQSSSLADVQIAGTDYKLFLQPIRLTLSASEDEKGQGLRWVVCGLTRTDHFRDETFAVSYTVLILFVFVVLLAVLSWPLLKLKLMGPKDRLRRADLGLTMLSALLGTALVTFILLDVHTYLSLEHTLDLNLEQLSGKIKANFQEEIAGALAQLRELNAKITTLAQEEKSGALKELGDSIKQSGILPPASPTPALSSKLNIFADGIDWVSAPYPYFNTATWTDPTGHQRIKWTTQPDTTAFVDVSLRQFFQNAKNGTLWLNRDKSNLDYSLEMVKLRTTGLNAAIIATRMPGSSWISNLDTRLLSLMGTVLPAGYGYAVIDSNGQVQFHSDEVKNLEEQFFAECENDRRLRAAVLARTERFIHTTYLGKGHRLYVSALPGTPWMLVVFRDKEIARTIHLELITLSLMLYLGFALIMIAVISATYLPKDGERIRWWWPDPRRARRYELLIALNILIGCIFVVALKVKGGWFLVSCCVALPVLATVLAALILRKDPWRDPVQDESGALGSGRALSYRTGYTIALAGLLTLAGVLPAAGFFQIASNFESKLMIKHGQVSIAKALEQRTQRVTAQYTSIKLGGRKGRASNAKEPQTALLGPQEETAAFIKQRLDPPGKSILDVYDSFFFGTRQPDSSQDQFVDDQLGGVDWLLARFRPLYNQSCVENQELSRGASSDGLWHWKLDGVGQIRLEKDKDGRKGEPSVALLTILPPAVPWLIAIVVVALLLFPIYELTCFVARRFFLLDMDLPCPAALGGSYVLLRSSMAPNGKKWNPEEYYVTDLSPVKDWPTWTKALTSNPAGAGLSVVLDNFEHCMDDPAASREKLAAIEHLLGDRRRVVVVSTVDPLSFCLLPRAKAVEGDNDKEENASSDAAAIEGEQQAPSEPTSIEGRQTPAAQNGQRLIPYPPESDIQARWAAAFTNFAVVFAADTSTPEFVKANPYFLSILKTNQPWRYIEVIGKGITGNGTPRSKNSRDRAKIEEQISQVMEQARPYHEALWKTCSEGQRCTLIQLAQDGMISPKNKHLRRLVKRGLVVRDPRLRLMDESFRRFVSSAAREQDIEGWRQQEGGSAWQVMKAPFLLIVFSVALFLFITQKDVYDSTISFMSAAAAGIAVLFRFLGMFQKGRSGNAAQS